MFHFLHSQAFFFLHFSALFFHVYSFIRSLTRLSFIASHNEQNCAPKQMISRIRYQIKRTHFILSYFFSLSLFSFCSFIFIFIGFRTKANERKGSIDEVFVCDIFCQQRKYIFFFSSLSYLLCDFDKNHSYFWHICHRHISLRFYRFEKKNKRTHKKR